MRISLPPATNTSLLATRILGIDPGSRHTGVGIIDASECTTKLVHFEVISPPPKAFPIRLKSIFEGVEAVISRFQPQQFAIEEVFMARNAQSALKLGQARGAAICAAVAAELSVAEYAARAVKQAIVGRGAADKGQMQHMIGILLSHREQIPEDAADALGVALCHAHHAQTQARLAVAQ